MLFLVRRWIAGETLNEAIRRAKKQNALGIKAILNILGEHLGSKEMVEQVKKEYLELIKAIKDNGVEGSISLKPSQIGMDVSFEYCLSNLRELAAYAENKGIFIWIDMENSTYTQNTLDLYLLLRKEYEGIGVALQAYLKRSEADLKRLLAEKARIRLVKGAYREPPEVCYASAEEIRKSFLRLMSMLSDKSEGFAVATHDEGLIKEAKKMAGGNKLEFQMLLGIGEELKLKLVEEGYMVADYIPYGKDWLPYFFRRLRERREKIALLLKSVIKR